MQFQFNLSPLVQWQFIRGEKLQETSYPHFSEYKFRKARQDIKTYEARQAYCMGSVCVGASRVTPQHCSSGIPGMCAVVPTLITQL